MKQLRAAHTYSCRVTIAPLRIKHPNVGLGLLAVKTLEEGDIAGLYYQTIVYHGLSLSQPTQMVYWDGVLKMDVVRFYKPALQLRVQRGRFDLIAKRLEKGSAVCCVSASFCVFAYTNDYRYARRGQRE